MKPFKAGTIMNSILNHRFSYLYIILTAFAIMIIRYYWMIHWRPDELWYCMQADSPFYDRSAYFRFFQFYTTKVLSFLFFGFNALEKCMIVSLIYSLGVIACSYYIILKLSGKTSAILGAILISTYSTLIYQATWFGSDRACLFFGLLALSFSISENKNNWIRFFFSGFFLLGSIYSKRSGLCFVIPIAIILFAHRDKKVFMYLLYGMMVSLLFIAVCDFIWLDDFFWHINPFNYTDFLSWFSGRVDYAREATGSGTKWTKTYFQQLLNYEFIHILLSAIVTAVLLVTNIGKKFGRQNYIAFAIFLISICSFTLHEVFHVWQTRLGIYPRYMLTMNIPFLISFVILLPIRTLPVNKNYEEGNNYFDLILIGFFSVILFFTGHYNYAALKSEWTLFNSILHIFSFWIFFAATVGIIYSGNLLRHIYDLKGHRYRKFLKGICYGCIIIISAYSIIWGNNFSNKHAKKGKRRIFQQFTSFEQSYKHDLNKVMMFELPKKREIYIRDVRMIFNYLYLSGRMEKSQYTETLTETSHVQDLPLKDLKNSQYQYLLTKYPDEEIQKIVEGYHIKLTKIWNYKKIYLYKKI